MTQELPDAVSGFDSLVGLELLEADGEHVLARLELGPRHHQPFGIVHGGVYCAAVETTASVGGAAWFGDRGHVVGVSNTTNFLRAAREGTLSVLARPIKQGRTQQLWNVDLTDEQGRLVATGQVRLANITSTEALGQ